MKVLVYSLMVFLWSWINWFVGLHYLSAGINDKTINQFVTFFFIGVYGPLLSAIVTTIYFNGFKGLFALLKKLTIWKVPFIIYLIIIFLPIVCLACALGLYSLFVGRIGRFDPHAVIMIPSILWASLLAGPLGEELGWRGFLLPELQNRFSAITSSLIIGVIWYCWHVPLFFAPFGALVSGAPLTFLPLLIYLVFVISLSCIYTWLVNYSKGSVLIALLIHLSINAGILLLFFPELKDQAKRLYFLSTPAFLLFAVYLGIKTKFEQKTSANNVLLKAGRT
ncbi:MAG: CPBP family intramembrane metalloprotease [Chitinophagaceae bacterium]|nr:CPBP family intramembrane metalloprotease [Chitinophagaceae bacterium]